MPKPSFPSRTIQGMLERHWGKISDFSPLSEGLDSRVFGFRSGGVDYGDL